MDFYHLYDANGAVANEVIVAAARVDASQVVRVRRLVASGPTDDWLVFEDTGGTERWRVYLGGGLDLAPAPGEHSLFTLPAGLGLQWDFASATAIALDIVFDIY